VMMHMHNPRLATMHTLVCAPVHSVMGCQPRPTQHDLCPAVRACRPLLSHLDGVTPQGV
jgi:hypothetical protein